MAIQIPGFPENRGPIRIDPATGSTLSLPTAYCRDLVGCGDKDYAFISQSMSVNRNLPDCKRRFSGSVSVKVVLDMQDDEINISDAGILIDYIRDQILNDLENFNCPPT